jgi:REP element-mobilizing transposase RayT
MSSPKRVHRRNFNHSGHAHELTFSCYRAFEFLKAERTCLWLIEEINTARVKHGVAVWAYVFMPEHVHLLLCPRSAEYDIAAIRQTIKEPVAKKAVRYLKLHSSEWLSRITVQKGIHTRHQFFAISKSRVPSRYSADAPSLLWCSIVLVYYLRMIDD